MALVPGVAEGFYGTAKADQNHVMRDIARRFIKSRNMLYAGALLTPILRISARRSSSKENAFFLTSAAYLASVTAVLGGMTMARNIKNLLEATFNPGLGS